MVDLLLCMTSRLLYFISGYCWCGGTLLDYFLITLFRHVTVMEISHPDFPQEHLLQRARLMDMVESTIAFLPAEATLQSLGTAGGVGLLVFAGCRLWLEVSLFP